MSRLLALDLSSNVGHAILVRGRPPTFGTLQLFHPDRARRLGAFLVWLEEMYAVHGFDGIAWERPLLLRTDKVDKLEILYGLVGIAYAFAGKHDLPWREVTVQEAKHALTGKSNADKSEMLFAAVRVMGWKATNDHEADAGAVGLVAYDRLWPKAKVAA